MTLVSSPLSLPTPNGEARSGLPLSEYPWLILWRAFWFDWPLFWADEADRFLDRYTEPLIAETPLPVDP